MHTYLHDCQAKILDLVKDKKDEIEDIYIVFNYPKDPHDKDNQRMYDKDHGGTMLDLGIYVFEEAREILEVLGLDLHQFDKENKDIWIKYTQEGVD